MTASQPTRSRGPAIVVGVIFVALVIAAAAGLWYLFFRPAGPAPVSLASAAARRRGLGRSDRRDVRRPGWRERRSDRLERRVVVGLDVLLGWDLRDLERRHVGRLRQRRHRHVRRLPRQGGARHGRCAGGRRADGGGHRVDDHRRHHHHRRRHHRRPHAAPERRIEPRPPAAAPGHRDRDLPDGDVQAHPADRARVRAGRRPGGRRHGDGRPDAPRRDQERADPAPGPHRRRRDRGPGRCRSSSPTTGSSRRRG